MGLFNKKKVVATSKFQEDAECAKFLYDSIWHLLDNKVPSKATKAAINDICSCIHLAGWQLPEEHLNRLKERELVPSFWKEK